jgi:hypothetical protein
LILTEWQHLAHQRYQILQMTAKLQAQNQREKASPHRKNYHSLVSRIDKITATVAPAGSKLAPNLTKKHNGPLPALAFFPSPLATYMLAARSGIFPSRFIRVPLFLNIYL